MISVAQSRSTAGTEYKI